MSVIRKIDSEFISICQQILKENLSAKEWNQMESADQFQTEHYCGGFDGSENEFTFSYYDKTGMSFGFNYHYQL
ncbi:MAG: hypothetical protein ABJN95_15405 [Maribacter sp.]|uniref:hypothetical protein n=1 Tax=Maribacter sp. TaxID=1897614 RepID=UPI003299DBBB